MDGFTLVVNKKKKRGGGGGGGRRPASKNAEIVTIDQDDEPPVTKQQISTLLSQIKRWMLKLRRTDLYSKLLQSIPTYTSVVCFGLGRLSVYRSQVQLALLKLVCEHLQFGAVYFDPSHNELDHCVLQDLGMVRLMDNDMGRWRIDGTTNSKTLFFMPHCDRWLYSNVLECNVDVLPAMHILGNSLLGYCERDERTKDYVSKICCASAEKTMVHETMFVLKEDEDLIDKTILFESFNDIGLIRFDA